MTLAKCAFFVLAALVIASWGLLRESHVQNAFFHHIDQAFENRFQRADLRNDEKVTGIISLGGGMNRVHEARKLANRYPDAVLIVSGPSDEEAAAVLADPSLNGRVIIDRTATNTFENAINAKILAKADAGETWLVVTSAWHMPRAMGAFQGAGFAVKPWPVRDAKQANQSLTHEILGLVAYRVLGRTQSFFPGPA